MDGCIASTRKLITLAGLLMKERKPDISSGHWKRDFGRDIYFAAIEINTHRPEIMHIFCAMAGIENKKAGEIKRKIGGFKGYAEKVLARHARRGVGWQGKGGVGTVGEDKRPEVPADKQDAQGGQDELTMESDISQGFWEKDLETGRYYAAITINIPRERCVQMVFVIGGIEGEKVAEIEGKIEDLKDGIEEILAG